MGGTMYNPKVGDKIRVTFEDVVTDIDAGSGVVLANAHYPGDDFVFDLDEPTLVGVDLVKPSVEMFKPGDRLRRKGMSYEITLADDGYLQHLSSGRVFWHEGLAGGNPPNFFSSEYFERVKLTTVPF